MSWSRASPVSVKAKERMARGSDVGNLSDEGDHLGPGNLSVVVVVELGEALIELGIREATVTGRVEGLTDEFTGLLLVQVAISISFGVSFEVTSPQVKRCESASVAADVVGVTA